MCTYISDFNNPLIQTFFFVKKLNKSAIVIYDLGSKNITMAIKFMGKI
jgi:hypothetical protein